MKKFSHAIFALGIILCLRAVAAWAQGNDELKIEQKASMGLQAIKEQARSSKFFEYRDVPRGFVFTDLNFSLTKMDSYIRFSGDRIRQNDARYNLDFGSYGTYKLNFEYNKIPHRFSFEGKSLYIETSPGDYQVSDEIQKAAEQAVGDGGDNGRNNIGLGRSLLSAYLTGVHPVELGLVRNRGSLGLAFTPSVPLSLNLQVMREERKGTRPLGASFGFSNPIEVPEPIDYRTTDMDANIEYAGRWGVVRTGLHTSIFDNQIQTLLWDNPYRITDQTYHTPSGAYSNGNGSVRGRMALPPSNSAFNYYLNGSLKLMKSTRLSGSLSVGSFSQDEKLLPFTINSALTHEFIGALEAPADTAKAKANIGSFNLSLNSRIFKDVYLNAGYRYYNFANKTRVLEFEEGYARLDQTWEDRPVETRPLSFVRTRLFSSVSFNMLSRISFNLGYTYNTIKREYGTSGNDEPGEGDDENTEGTFKASVDTHPADWLLFRVSYLSAKRKWSLEGTEGIYIPGFNFRRYFQADRDRQTLNLLADLSLIKNLGLTFTYILGKEKYPKSEYGLRKNDLTAYSVDLSYQLGRSASLYGFYEAEKYNWDQAYRRGGASSSAENDWTASLNDTVDTFGGGLATALMRDIVTLDLSYTYSRTKGDSHFYSPPGGNPDVALDFDKLLDTTTLHILKASLTWKLRQNLALALEYWYEQYDLEDITRNDWKVDALWSGAAIYLGALEPGYKYHVTHLKFIWNW